MINLFLTRRQLFLLVVGTPLATILLFILGVYSGAAIGAPGPVVVEPEQPATQNASQAAETDLLAPSTQDAAAPLSIPDSDTRAAPTIHPFSRAHHSVRVERDNRGTAPETTAKSTHRPTEGDPAPERLYSIQAGVFAELANARKLDRSLKARGLASQLEVVDGPEAASERYRVRIGLFDTRAAAMAALEAQDQDVLPDAFIVSRPLNQS